MVADAYVAEGSGEFSSVIMTTELYFEICAWFAGLVKGTKWEGHVFAVGGCCRDEILGREIKDLDLAVDLPGGGVDFARWLQRRKLTVGSPIFFLKFGTAKLRLRRWPGEEIEIVQTRAEKYTKKTSRCPEVCSGTIEEDCYRRDFTVNTLYRDISTDRILDMTGRGIHDIKEGILRTPMDPDKTFDDDPVRILRCIRFATRFGWEIEKETMAALERNIDRLAIVSRERNRAELGKMIAGNNPVKALNMLRDLDALNYMLPLLGEMSGHESKRVKGLEKDEAPSVPDCGIPKFPKEESEAIWKKAMDTLGNIEDHDLPLRLAALFADVGKIRTRVRNRKGVVSYPNYEMVGANMARRALRSLKFEPAELDELAFLILNQNDLALWGEFGELMTDKELRRLQMKAGSRSRFDPLLKLVDARAGHKVPSPLTQRVAQRTDEMEDEGSDLFDRAIKADAVDAHLKNPPRRPRRNGYRKHRRHRKRDKGVDIKSAEEYGTKSPES